MTLRISDFEWDPDLVEKNRAKHGVEPEDVKSALLNTDPAPYWRRVQRKKYRAWAQVQDGGDYLFIVFSMPKPGVVRTISARRMDRAERAEFRARRVEKQNR
jgi:uncharacterized DUF497 family protein